ncbi:hypothetical protein NPIL_281451 [Nephila pilipes]|uniref:Uncharacterized protein n=1 Tax=Nephila pilipes TaxID=299642 RepID=A0A8X6TVT7_NEPPI|nr:hypothetical protein NPIL_281451 [Nephila pilipes]
MPHPGQSIQEALALLEEFSSDTESVLSDDSTDYEDCAPFQFPTELPPDNLDKFSDAADNDIYLPDPSQLATEFTRRSEKVEKLQIENYSLPDDYGK